MRTAPVTCDKGVSRLDEEGVNVMTRSMAAWAMAGGLVALSAPAAAQGQPAVAPGPEAHQAAAPAGEGHGANLSESAEHEHHEPSRAWVDWVTGYGHLGTGETRTEFSSMSFVAGGLYRLGNFAPGLRLPLTVGMERRALESSHSETVLGNVELSGAYFLHPMKHAELPLELAVALPTAMGNPTGGESAEQHFLAQEIAAASRGLEDNALFMPRHLGVIPKIGFDYEDGTFAFGIYQKMELLFKAGAESSATLEAKGTAVASVTQINASYSLIHRMLWVGARAWAFYDIVAPYESKLAESDESKLQTMVEPTVGGRIGDLIPNVGFLIPIGGRLADDHVKALRINVRGEF